MDLGERGGDSDEAPFVLVQPPEDTVDNPTELAEDIQGSTEVLGKLKRTWLTAEERERVRQKRIEEAEKLPTVFPFAPASWDQVKVRSEEEVEQDAANAELGHLTFGSVPIAPIGRTENFLMCAGTGAFNEAGDGFFGGGGQGRAFPDLGPLTGAPFGTLPDAEEEKEGAPLPPFSFLPESAGAKVNSEEESRDSSLPLSDSKATTNSPSPVFSFTALPSASSATGAPEGSEGSPTLFPSFSAPPAAQATTGWTSESKPLRFGVGVSECVGDLDPDEDENIQVFRLQMPTYSFSSVASGKSKEHQLEAAISANDVDAVRELAPNLSQEEISSRNWSLETPIVVAAKEEKWEIVEILANVMSKKELNYNDASGRTALNWAARHGNTHILKLLLNKVQPEGKELTHIDQQVAMLLDGNGESPVHSAVLGSQVEALKILAEHLSVQQLNMEDGEKVTPLALCATVDAGAELAAILADALPKEVLIVRSFQGVTALDAAIAEKNEALTELLIERAPTDDVGYIFPDGSSHMHAACAAGNLQAVKKLIEKVPNFVVASNGGKVPPIALAASKGCEEIVDVLLEHLKGVREVQATDDTGDNVQTNASLLAAENGYDEIAMKIISVQGGLDFYGRLLAKAFGRSDSKFLKFLLAFPERVHSFYGDKAFQFEIPKAPVEKFALMFEAFPTRPLNWLNFGASVVTDFSPERMEGILKAARKHCSLAMFLQCLDAAMYFAVRGNSKELLGVGLSFYDDEVIDTFEGSTPGLIHACQTAGNTDLLMVVLEALPERAFVDELYSTCSVFSDALPRSDFLQVYFDWLPRKLWTLPRENCDENVVLGACRACRTSDNSCLWLILDIFTEEELLTPNGSGHVLTHLAWSLPDPTLDLVLEKLGVDAFLIPDKAGWTALHHVAAKGADKQLDWLLQHLPLSAKSVRDRMGQTPLEVASGRYSDQPSEKMREALTVQPKAALRKG